MLHLNKVHVIVILIFVVSIFFILRVNNTNIVEVKKGSDCSVVEEGKNGKVDIVFLPYGYNDDKKFLSDIDTYIYGNFGFKNLEPFKANFQNINFYAVMDKNIKCDVIDNTIICDELSTRSAAARCPNDYIVVLYDRDAIKDFIVPIRSSAYLNTASINVADDPLVLPHEFAHICCNLADEYVEEGVSIDINKFENCDLEECPRWNFFNGTGCYQGCGEINFYRSIDIGIMRNYIIGKEFGVWNEYLILKYIQ